MPRRELQIKVAIAIFILLALLRNTLATLVIYVSALSLHHPQTIHGEDLILTRSNNTQSPAPTIPLIIHTTYATRELPAHWIEARKSCTDKNPDFEHRFYTDDELLTFIDENYKWFIIQYKSYRYNIQRVDAARYFLLYHYGGIYMDLDIGCKKRLEPLLITAENSARDLKHIGILPQTKPVGMSNDFMASSKNHPFFLNLIESLKKSNQYWFLPYLQVFFSAGPAFLTQKFFEYEWFLGGKDILVMGDELYGDSKSEYMMLRHYAGNSWHGSDVPVYVFVYKHWSLLFILGFLFAITRRRFRRILAFK